LYKKVPHVIHMGFSDVIESRRYSIQHWTHGHSWCPRGFAAPFSQNWQMNPW